MSRAQSCLSNWREVVLLAESILSWEKDYYPGIIAAVITVTFLFIWYMDLSVLTLLALCGLNMICFDFLVPKIIAQIYKPDTWTGMKEKKFEGICSELEMLGESMKRAYTTVIEAKYKKPMIHFVSTLVTLLTLAWIGNNVNNLFLLYVTTLVIAMMPGLHRKGLLKKYLSGIILKVAEFYKGKDALKKVE